MVDIGIFLYPKIFHLFRFPSSKSSDPKIIGIETYLFENFSQKKDSPKIIDDLFRVKISQKWAIIPFLDVRKS